MNVRWYDLEVRVNDFHVNIFMWKDHLFLLFCSVILNWVTAYICVCLSFDLLVYFFFPILIMSTIFLKIYFITSLAIWQCLFFNIVLVVLAFCLSIYILNHFISLQHARCLLGISLGLHWIYSWILLNGLWYIPPLMS